MPVRATKRGAQRTPLSGSWDVLGFATGARASSGSSEGSWGFLGSATGHASSTEVPEFAVGEARFEWQAGEPVAEWTAAVEVSRWEVSVAFPWAAGPPTFDL